MRKKMLLFMVLLGIALIGLIFLIMNALLVSSILHWERKNTEQNVLRIKNILQDETVRLESIVRDWANWDDTYAFVANPRREFIENNLMDEFFSDLQLDFIVFLNSRAEMVFQKGYDLVEGKEISVPASLGEHLQPGSPLLQRQFTGDDGELNLEKGEVSSGLILLPEGPVLIAASPILTSRYSGPPAGTLLVGSFFNAAEVSGIAEKLFVTVSVQPPEEVADAELKKFVASLSDEILIVRDGSGERIEGYNCLKDIYGNPALLLKVELPREVYGIGKRALTFFFLSLCFIVLAFWGGIYSFLEKTILSKLTRLIRSARELRASCGFSGQIGGAEEPDEFSAIAMEIKTIMGKLENSRIKMQESEEQLQVIFEESPVGIALLDREGRFLKSNTSLQVLLGVQEEELHHSTIFEKIFPRDLLKGISMIEELLAANREYCQFDSRFACKNGKLVWGRLSLTLVRNSRGDFQYALGMLENITEYKRVEELLQKNEERLYRQNKTLMELTVKGAWVNESLDEAVKEIVEAASFLIPTERVSVWRYEDNFSRAVCFDLYERSKNSHSRGEQISSEDFFRYSRSHLEGDVIAVVDVFIDLKTSVLPSEYFLKTGIASLLDAPIWLRGKLWGVFSFEHVGSPREWSSEDQRLAMTMATYISLCLEEDARKKTEQALDEEIEKARQVHERSLQEQFPQIEGIDFAAHYQPARVLGGDFYHVKREGEQLIFYLADVSGHGLDGAILSVFIKNTIDNYLSLGRGKEKLFRPEEILHYLTEQFYKEKYPEDYFISIFLGVLDLNTNKCSFSGAGFQNSPIAVLPGGECIPLVSRGLPISPALPVEMMRYQSASQVLPPGTTVLFTTDGLAEQSRNGEEYSERLKNIFIKNCHLTPEQIVRIINDDFAKFNGSLQGDDDITFLIMQLNRKANSLSLKLKSSFQSIEEATREVELFLHGDAEFDLLPLREMLTNAIEHGNRFDPCKEVFLKVTETDRYVKIIVQDQGEGFNWQDILGKNLDPESLEERGRGIYLARMSSDFLSYNNKGNRVTIIRMLNP